MADLSLRLPIVLCSPSDVSAERDLLERAVVNLQPRALSHRILLEPVRWEKVMRPGAGRTQQVFNELHLQRAELVVFAFWSSLGSKASSDGTETGSLEELRIAHELVRRGASDDLFIYFKRSSDQHAEVRNLREQIHAAKKETTWNYSGPEDLADTFEQHLTQWFDRWIGIPQVCQQTIWRYPPDTPADATHRENRLLTVIRRMDIDSFRELCSALGKQAVGAYQRAGPKGWSDRLTLTGPLSDSILHDPEDAPTSWARDVAFQEIESFPLVRMEPGGRFSSPEWFFFFCAAGLLDAIVEGRHNAVEKNPYVNQVHQYLAALVERWSVRLQIVARLVEWLDPNSGSGRGRPVVRNFAAYVLGMIQAVEAENALADRLREDHGTDVRIYSICALGKLRSRRHLGTLRDEHGRSDTEHERSIIGQAICRITGVAYYEL